MKAVLVIEIYDDISMYSVDVYKQNEDGDVMREVLTDLPLSPLPEKSDYEPKDDHVYSKAEIMAYTYGITVGRNQVIDEIIGETE